jgi:hypothetical protein
LEAGTSSEVTLNAGKYRVEDVGEFLFQVGRFGGGIAWSYGIW